VNILSIDQLTMDGSKGSLSVGDIGFYFCKDSLEDTIKHIKSILSIIEFYSDKPIDIVDQEEEEEEEFIIIDQ